MDARLEKLLDDGEVLDTFADAAQELNLNIDHCTFSNNVISFDVWSNSGSIDLSFTYPLYELENMRSVRRKCPTIEEAKEIIQEEIMDW